MAQPPPTYMWFRLEPSGKTQLEGVTGEFLQFDSLLADDRGVYSCSVANELGSIDSEDAILSIEGNVIIQRGKMQINVKLRVVGC